MIEKCASVPVSLFSYFRPVEAFAAMFSVFARSKPGSRLGLLPIAFDSSGTDGAQTRPARHEVEALYFATARA